MITLVIPAYTAGPNIERTIESARSICDEVVVISTAIFLNDVVALRKIATVVDLPWNFVFHHGFGSLHNQGTMACKNDWMLLLGVAETFAEPFIDIHARLRAAVTGDVFRCSHVNDANTWKRIWNRQGGSMWSGIIHEEIMGLDQGVIFRMQDTNKEPNTDSLRNEVFRSIKALSYNYLYSQLLRFPNRLGAADEGWLRFVQGASGSINAFCTEHAELLDACIEGDAAKFINLVEKRMNAGQHASGVNFQPLG